MSQYKPTQGVTRVLGHIEAGRGAYSGVSGMGEHGAMRGILVAINKRGLVDWGDDGQAPQLTSAGIAALARARGAQ